MILADFKVRKRPKAAGRFSLCNYSFHDFSDEKYREGKLACCSKNKEKKMMKQKPQNKTKRNNDIQL